MITRVFNPLLPAVGKWYVDFHICLSSGEAGGCQQDSRSINDYLQQVSPHTVSSDLSLWRKQSMDCCSAQSDAFFSCLLPTRDVQTPSMFVWGGERGMRYVYCFFPMNFNILSFSLRHYLEETAFLLLHILKMHLGPAFYLLFWFSFTSVLLKYSTFYAMCHTPILYCVWPCGHTLNIC